jgi:hypothetical protein
MFVHGTRHHPANLPPGQATDQRKVGRPAKITVPDGASPIRIPSRQDDTQGPVPIPRARQPEPATIMEAGAAMLDNNGKTLRDQEGYQAFVRANNYFFARGCALEKKGHFGRHGGSNLYSAHLEGASRTVNVAPLLKKNHAERVKEKINAFAAAVRRLDPRNRPTGTLAGPVTMTATHAGIAAVRLIATGLDGANASATLQVADGALGVMGSVTSVMYAVLSTSDAIDVCASKREAERIGFANQVGARECIACLLQGWHPERSAVDGVLCFHGSQPAIGRFQ